MKNSFNADVAMFSICTVQFPSDTNVTPRCMWLSTSSIDECHYQESIIANELKWKGYLSKKGKWQVCANKQITFCK